MKPEDRVRVLIDDRLLAAGWHICDMAQADTHAAPGVALREFPLNTGHGVADYLLYVNGKACGVIEAKKSVTLKGLEVQSERYVQGKALPPKADEESTEGLESLFKDPEPIGYNPAVTLNAVQLLNAVLQQHFLR